MTLPSALDVSKSVTVDVEAVFSHILRPYPSEITQVIKKYKQGTIICNC